MKRLDVVGTSVSYENLIASLVMFNGLKGGVTCNKIFENVTSFIIALLVFVVALSRVLEGSKVDFLSFLYFKFRPKLIRVK